MVEIASEAYLQILRWDGPSSVEHRMFHPHWSSCLHLKWGWVYKRPVEVNRDLADSIVKVTCILCNDLRHEVEGLASQDDSFDDADSSACLQEIQRPRGNWASAEALHIPDTFKQYFVSPAGQLPWQYDHLCCGLIG
eukprot:superscaffoldBa00004442_g18886